jgi:hypothetical protein
MSKNLQESRNALAKEQEELLEQRVLYLFFKKFPNLNCQANELLLIAFHNGEPITLESLEESALALGGKLATLGSAKVQANAAEEAEQARAEVAAENARRQSLSPDELREEIKASKPDLSRRLPQHWTVGGQTVELTGDAIRSLPGPELRRLVTLFGSAEINKRLGSPKTNFNGQIGRIQSAF